MLGTSLNCWIEAKCPYLLARMIEAAVFSMPILITLLLSDEVTFKELLHDLKEVVDWWSFGKAVNLSHIQLLIIHQEGKTTDKCRALMIEKWMKLEKLTWSTIVSSLFKCGLVALGWRLAAKHSYLTKIVLGLYLTIDMHSHR